eukprot:7328197-Ditylum_brightwellii.AAC.1
MKGIRRQQQSPTSWGAVKPLRIMFSGEKEEGQILGQVDIISKRMPQCIKANNKTLQYLWGNQE